MKYFHRIFSILLIAGMLLGWTSSGANLASASMSNGSQADASAKFEPLALQQLTAGNADFFVVMALQADLSHADQLKTKAEKGAYVFQTLVSTADRTQANLRLFLDQQGAKYTSFYITNSILVKAGSLNLARAIATRADVSQISANHTYQLDKPFIDPNASNNPTGIESNITFIHAPQVWALGVTGQGTVVAGNDTGLDETHPAIKAHYRGCVDPPECTTYDNNYNWWDATHTYPNNPWDGMGHGTHTTGTMVGDDGGTNQIGVAPGAQTIHCKNMDDGGSGVDEWFLTCFEWDLAPWDLNHANPRPDLAPDAVNNSWGYWGGGQNQFRTAIDNLEAAGTLVEVSSGNEGSGCSTLRSPGDYSEVLTTGSVNHVPAYPGTITGFSSRGPSSLEPGFYFPDVMAPGENIRSSVPGGGYEGGWSGTSMAGPHATALIALMWSANPALRGQVTQTMEIIHHTAVPLTGQNGSHCGGDYTTGPNNDWGFGTIDAMAAVQEAIAMGGAGRLHGTVTDADTGAQVEGVNILAEHEQGFAWNVNTNASGYYTMTVAAGTYTVTASADGYLPEVIYPVEVITDEVTLQDFSIQYVPNVLMTPADQTQNGEPGMQVNYVYTVTNDAHVPQEIGLSLQSNWLAQAPTTTGVLAAEASVAVPVTVTIPTMPLVIIASDTFTMTAVGSVGGTFVATGTTRANVTAGVAVAGPANDTGRPGEQVSYQFVVTNTGNYTDSFTLSSTGVWPSSLPGGPITPPMPPGTNVTVTVLINIPGGAPDGATCITTFRATSNIDHLKRASVHVTTTADTTYFNLLPLVRR